MLRRRHGLGSNIVRVAAVGDSFTEGLGDEDKDGNLIGWADRVALGLAEHLDEPVYYANFAIRGRLLEPIATEQIDAALALNPKPDMILLNGGGNDMMRPRFQMERILQFAQRAIDACQEAGVRLVIVTGGLPTPGLPLAKRMTRLGHAYLAAVQDLCERNGVELIVNWNDTAFPDRRNWSDDRLHLNPTGHARVAANVLTALGHPTDPPAPGDEIPAPTFRDQVRYTRVHVLPFIGRRLTRRSSGDGHLPKYPDWTQLHVTPT